MNISLLLEIGIFRKVSCSTHDFLRGCSPSRKSPIGSFPQHFQAARFSASSCFDLEVKYASTGTKSGWCKKFFKIPLSNGEEKHVVFIIAMNTTRNKISNFFFFFKFAKFKGKRLCQNIYRTSLVTASKPEQMF